MDTLHWIAIAIVFGPLVPFFAYAIWLEYMACTYKVGKRD